MVKKDATHKFTGLNEDMFVLIWMAHLIAGPEIALLLEHACINP